MPGNVIASILIVGAGALLAGRAGGQEVRKPAPISEQTLDAVAACGVPAANVRIVYADELQSDVVEISDLGGSDEARFRCVSDAVHPVYIVWIEAENQRNAYEAFTSRVEETRYRAEATEQLRQLGMLDKAPRYDPRRGLEAFARSLESACLICPGRALETVGSSGLTIRRSFFEGFMTPKIEEEFTCLLRMTAVSNADEQGIELGFTGSEAPGGGRP